MATGLEDWFNKIQDYYHLSLNYLESARISLKKELFEPAMFSAIHALELSLKAALWPDCPGPSRYRRS